MCMQCGVCSGSCPIGVQMDHGPQKLFMMIRAGMKEEVLSANTHVDVHVLLQLHGALPARLPITHIMQDLAAKSAEFGYAEGPHENKNFAQSFWWSTEEFGRTDERLVTMRYFFSLGLGEGFKRAMANLKIALGMVKTGRMHIGAAARIKAARACKRSSPRRAKSNSGSDRPEEDGS